MSTTKLAIKSGLLITLALIAYFAIMGVLGLNHHFELSYFNIVIVFGGLYFALKSYAKTFTHDHIPYLKGLLFGGGVSLIPGILFSTFMLIYASANQNFVERIHPNLPVGSIEPGIVGGVLSIAAANQTFIMGFVSTFILMMAFRMDIFEEKETSRFRNTWQEIKKRREMHGSV